MKNLRSESNQGWQYSWKDEGIDPQRSRPFNHNMSDHSGFRGDVSSAQNLSSEKLAFAFLKLQLLQDISESPRQK